MMDDQREIRDSVETFLAQEGPVAHLRHLRDAGDTLGYSPTLWRQFAGMGYAGMLVPESHGGLGLSLHDACIVMEGLGRHLTPSPFLSTAILAAHCLDAYGSPAHQAAWLPRIARAEAVVTLAIGEVAKYDPFAIATNARRMGDGWRISGAKTFVLDGHAADALIVAARTAGERRDRDGITLFLVEAAAAGLTRERVVLADHRSVARIALNDVQVGQAAILGEVGQGDTILAELGLVGSIATAAELLGVAAEALAMTLSYLNTRRQFGSFIGEFQALQHRAARMHVELELARPVVAHAAQRGPGDDDRARLASVAKAKACAMSALIVREAVQMHGGIGVTDEYDLGFFMKRQRVLSEAFGDERFHLDALATHAGY